MEKEIIILTGATGAIGTELARRIAKSAGESESPLFCRELLLACRNTAKAERLQEELTGEFPQLQCSVAELDLEDAGSVRRFAALPQLSGANLTLMNNAGVMRRTFATDRQGRELSLVVNYFNTRLLTELLLDTGRLRRVVFTTSLTRFFYRPFTQKPIVTQRGFHQLRTYGLSKRLITDYAARLHASGRCTVTCADPGVVNTGMIHMSRWYDPLADRFFRPFIRTPRRGSLPAFRALSAPSGVICCARRQHPLPAIN